MLVNDEILLCSYLLVLNAMGQFFSWITFDIWCNVSVLLCKCFWWRCQGIIPESVRDSVAETIEGSSALEAVMSYGEAEKVEEDVLDIGKNE